MGAGGQGGRTTGADTTRAGRAELPRHPGVGAAATRRVRSCRRREEENVDGCRVREPRRRDHRYGTPRRRRRGRVGVHRATPAGSHEVLGRGHGRGAPAGGWDPPGVCRPRRPSLFFIRPASVAHHHGIGAPRDRQGLHVDSTQRRTADDLRFQHRDGRGRRRARQGLGARPRRDVTKNRRPGGVHGGERLRGPEGRARGFQSTRRAFHRGPACQPLQGFHAHDRRG